VSRLPRSADRDQTPARPGFRVFGACENAVAANSNCAAAVTDFLPKRGLWVARSPSVERVQLAATEAISVQLNAFNWRSLTLIFPTPFFPAHIQEST
jgi:hypothetical protein